jgi:probable O-glycosylation ligase (exosortase A-associated)
MLRSIFVALLILGGAAASLNGPFNALLFYLWNAYFRPESWVFSGWVASLQLSFGIGIGLLVLTLANVGKLRPRMTTQTVLMTVFFVQTFVSTLTSVSQDYSWLWWTEFAKVMIIGYLITLHVDSPNRVRTICLIIVVSLGMEAAKQGFAQLVLNPGGRNANEHPVLGDNNGVALGMFMLAPLLPALANTTTRRLEKWFWWFFCLAIVYRGISTYSRGGLLAAGAVGLVYLWNSKRRIQAALIVCVTAGVVLSVMPQQFWNRMDTITAEEGEQDASVRGRLHFWAVALEMAGNKPLTGVGFNAFSRAYDSYDDTAGAFGFARAVHSSWFGVLAETGFPGLILLVSIVGRAFLACSRARKLTRGRKTPEGEVINEFARALQSTLIAYVVGGSFLNAHYSEMFWHFAWLTIAVESVASDVRAHREATAAAPAMPVLVSPRRPYAVAR